jgi:hypothetical protein
MENEASKARSLDIAFVVDADLLRQLAKVLGEMGDSLEYQVKFSDGRTIQYRDIEDIISQPNSKGRDIVSLTAGVTGRGKQSAFIVLREAPSPNVEYTINGTQRNVIYFGEKLDEWTEGIRQWHSFFLTAVPGVALLLVVVFAPIILWNNASPHFFSEAVRQGKAESWIKPVFVIGLWVIEYGILRLFPRAIFAVGQGIKRHQLFTYIRNGILGAFLLSVLASVFANWLTRHP